MASRSQTITKLNEIRALEQRMSLVYRRAAQLTSGPHRMALAEEFEAHASEEDGHAATVMQHIMGMDGDLTPEIENLPIWRNLNEVLRDLESFEEEGIKAWQELERMLNKDDPFRHTISTIIDEEVHHLDDVRQWLRDDDFSAKSLGDHGSLRPLNYREPQFHESAKKAVPWQEQLQSHSQHGTPPTRRGAFNGQPPALEPSMPAELNPPLVINKAVLQSQGPAGSSSQFQRKRDASGKFMEQQEAGAESTAADDVTEEKRKAELRSAKQRQQQRNPYDAASAGKQGARRAKQLGLKKGAPGFMSTADSDSSLANDAENGEVMTTLSDGTPLYSDPFHPSHENFSPEQHQEAADIHRDMSQNAVASGDSAEEDRQLNYAAAHEAGMDDAMSPMDRAMGNLAGAPAQGQPPAPAANPAEQMNQAFKALNYSYAPDDLDQFTQQRDMNKPSFGQRNDGPAPGMQHTATGGQVGPQTDPGAAFPAPPMDPGMPPEGDGGSPDAGAAPMDISGQDQQPNMDAGAVPPMDQGAPPPMDAGAPPSLDGAMDSLAAAPGQGQPPMDPGAAPPAPPAPPMDQSMAPPPDQGMAPPMDAGAPPMDQGMAPPPPDQGMAPPMDPSMPPPPPGQGMDPNMAPPPMDQGLATGNPPIDNAMRNLAAAPGQGVAPPMDQGMGQDPGMDLDSMAHVDDEFGWEAIPEVSPQDASVFYGTDAAPDSAPPAAPGMEQPPMDAGAPPMDAGAPPMGGEEPPMGDEGGDEGVTSASAPPNPFGGNGTEDKADKENAPPGANQEDTGGSSSAFMEGGDQGPANEPKDEKKTFGLDALKSWNARH